MPFEKFTATGRSYRPKITIRATGSIGFTTAAINRFAVHRYKFVVLYYDKEEGKMAIRLTNDEEDGIHKINRSKNSTWVAARRFFDFYEIPTKSERFDAIWDEDKELIVIDLKGGDASNREKRKTKSSG